MQRLLLILFAACGVARADTIAVPADAPPVYMKECGECHVAYPPQLLDAGDWKNVMDNLHAHYGDNAVIGEQARQEITDFLTRNADSNGYSAGANSMRSPLPKLTRTGWFRHAHIKITNTLWTGNQVRSRSNCGACHMRAEQGSFQENEIRMPGDPRRERGE
ncbi:MAG: diheme cytochrome c [Zoogloeaceae bacterium]|jgi:mono/diheme cytochrome c family protein|nr:diheme cytochrome c [Zoogloeaceae bacterium]